MRDPGIVLIGYQANTEELALGLFYFNHSCKGTLAVNAGDFKDLYDGPVFRHRATGSEDCKGFCLKPDELGRCPAQCECAYVREILQIIKNWRKDSPGKNGS